MIFIRDTLQGRVETSSSFASFITDDVVWRIELKFKFHINYARSFCRWPGNHRNIEVSLDKTVYILN